MGFASSVSSREERKPRRELMAISALVAHAWLGCELPGPACVLPGNAVLPSWVIKNEMREKKRVEVSESLSSS